MQRTRSVSIAVIVIIIASLGFLKFTAPGHHILASLGFATADCAGSNC